MEAKLKLCVFAPSRDAFVLLGAGPVGKQTIV